MADSSGLFFEAGGTEGPLLVLLHGLHANAAVWHPFEAVLTQHWAGSWIAPDFRGHGRSGHARPYSIERHAMDVAALLRDRRDVTLVGHSMGGLVAIVLGSMASACSIRQVVAFGVKTDWSDEDVARTQRFAQAPAKTFATRGEAVERYLRLSGLHGLVDSESDTVAAGIACHDGAYMLATDPAVGAIERPDIARIASGIEAPLTLLCGDRDAIASPEGMSRFGAPVRILAGQGHNVHVEAPEVFWDAVKDSLPVAWRTPASAAGG